MTEQDKQIFAETLFGVAEIYDRQISPQLLDVWFEIFKQYDIGDFKTAASRHTKNTEQGTFFPKPADIIRLLEGSGGTRATEAWNRVMGALSSVGTYRTVDFQDAAIHYAISEMGGWIEFGLWDNSETPFKQKRFEDLYRAHIAAPRGNPPAQLIGKADAENRNAGQNRWIEGAVKIPQLGNGCGKNTAVGVIYGKCAISEKTAVPGMGLE